MFVGFARLFFFVGTTLHPQQLLRTGSTVAIAISGMKKQRGGDERKKE